MILEKAASDDKINNTNDNQKISIILKWLKIQVVKNVHN